MRPTNPRDLATPLFVASRLAIDHSTLGNRAGGAGRTKNLTIIGQPLYFEKSGPTNNCQTKDFLRWSDQSDPPSATPREQNRTEQP